MPDNKLKKLRREKRSRGKKGQLRNTEYEAGLKKQGYTITKSEAIGGGSRRYFVEKGGVGSAIIRSDNPDPQIAAPRMKVVKKAPRSTGRKTTRRKFKGGSIK